MRAVRVGYLTNEGQCYVSPNACCFSCLLCFSFQQDFAGDHSFFDAGGYCDPGRWKIWLAGFHRYIRQERCATTKRDAYECYAADCSKTAGWARMSFDRLWAICEVLPDDVLHPVASNVESVCIAAVIADDGSADPARSTTG